MRYLLTILGVIPLTFTNAQKPADEVVYKTIMDMLVTCNDFEFYYPTLLHNDTQEYSDNPLDSIIVFSLDTYEEVSKSALDVVIEHDSINLQEARLFRQRIHFPNGLYLISKIESSHLHKTVLLQEYIDLESYPKTQDLPVLSASILRKGSIGPYSIRPSTQDNIATYKYAIKAYFAFSGVVWDKSKTYCLVECGYHYRISDKHPDRGPSGGGMQVIMKNENGIPRIIKSISLWEE